MLPKYICLTFKEQTHSIVRYDFDKYPLQLIEQLTALDFYDNVYNGKGITGWELYSLEVDNHYLKSDWRYANDTIKREMMRYERDYITNLYYNQRDKKREATKIWKDEMSSTEGIERLKKYVQELLIQTNRKSLHPTTTTEEGQVVIDNDAIKHFSITDIKTTDTTLSVTASVVLEATTITSNKKLLLKTPITVEQGLYNEHKEVIEGNEVLNQDTYYVNLKNIKLNII